MKYEKEKLYQRINLPAEYWSVALGKMPDACIFKDFVTTVAEDINAFVSQGKNILFWGDFGSGKTASASILLKAALNRGLFGLWLSSEELINCIMTDTYFDEDNTVAQRASDVPIFLLDELILRRPAREKEMMWERMIRSRLVNKRSTIITTNHSPGVIESLHPALYNVFYGHYHIVECRGYNFRKSSLE